MSAVNANDGDTWASIAQGNTVPLTSLLVANGIDPNSSPDPPVAGTAVQLPDPPPDTEAAPGGDHLLDTAEETTLWVRLELSPDDAANERGSLRLYSADGAHDVTIAIADKFVANDATVDVLFDSVDAHGTYSLDYVTEDGVATTLVQDAAFSDLQDGTASGAQPGPGNA